MMVWKMFLLFQGCILRFHVNLPGCTSVRLSSNGWYAHQPKKKNLTLRHCSSAKGICDGNLSMNSCKDTDNMPADWMFTTMRFMDLQKIRDDVAYFLSWDSSWWKSQRLVGTKYSISTKHIMCFSDFFKSHLHFKQLFQRHGHSNKSLLQKIAA